MHEETADRLKYETKGGETQQLNTLRRSFDIILGPVAIHLTSRKMDCPRRMELITSVVAIAVTKACFSLEMHPHTHRETSASDATHCSGPTGSGLVINTFQTVQIEAVSGRFARSGGIEFTVVRLGKVSYPWTR